MENATEQPGLDALKFAWSGEIYGMAFFEQLRDHYQGRREVWSTLYEIEVFTEDYLRQRLSGVLTLSDEQQREMISKGVHDAGEWLYLPWQLLCPRMRDWIDPWQQTYRDWQQQSRQPPHQPPQAQNPYQAEFTVIHLHETAIYHYWQAATAHDEQAYPRLLADFSHLQQVAAGSAL